MHMNNRMIPKIIQFKNELNKLLNKPINQPLPTIFPVHSIVIAIAKVLEFACQWLTRNTGIN